MDISHQLWETHGKSFSSIFQTSYEKFCGIEGGFVKEIPNHSSEMFDFLIIYMYIILVYDRLGYSGYIVNFYRFN